MKEAFTVKSITKYGDVIDAVGNNMKTNMTFDEMKSFLDYAKGGIPKVTTLTLTGHDNWPTSSYYYIDEKNLEQNKLEMQTHLEFAPTTKSLSDSKSGVSDTNESADEGSNNN